MRQAQSNVRQKCGSRFRRRISAAINSLNWIRRHGRNATYEPGLRCLTWSILKLARNVLNAKSSANIIPTSYDGKFHLVITLHHFVESTKTKKWVINVAKHFRSQDALRSRSTQNLFKTLVFNSLEKKYDMKTERVASVWELLITLICFCQAFLFPK